jgi:hypothetical protein
MRILIIAINASRERKSMTSTGLALIRRGAFFDGGIGLGHRRIRSWLIAVLIGIALTSNLIPVTPGAAQADMLPYGPGRGPPPPTALIVFGSRILDQLHQAGFACVSLRDAVEQPQPGIDPEVYAAKRLIPLKVTCDGGRHFFVALPLSSSDSTGEVVALD